MPPIINQNDCTGCGFCIDICPSDVFRDPTTSGNPPQVTYPDECWHCGACIFECPAEAIRLQIPLAMRPHAVKVGLKGPKDLL
jgi:adenylylsulfate reductase subunit B